MFSTLKLLSNRFLGEDRTEKLGKFFHQGKEKLGLGAQKVEKAAGIVQEKTLEVLVGAEMVARDVADDLAERTEMVKEVATEKAQQAVDMMRGVRQRVSEVDFDLLRQDTSAALKRVSTASVAAVLLAGCSNMKLDSFLGREEEALTGPNQAPPVSVLKPTAAAAPPERRKPEITTVTGDQVDGRFQKPIKVDVPAELRRESKEKEASWADWQMRAIALHKAGKSKSVNPAVHGTLGAFLREFKVSDWRAQEPLTRLVINPQGEVVAVEKLASDRDLTYLRDKDGNTRVYVYDHGGGPGLDLTKFASGKVEKRDTPVVFISRELTAEGKETVTEKQAWKMWGEGKAFLVAQGEEDGQLRGTILGAPFNNAGELRLGGEYSIHFSLAEARQVAAHLQGNYPAEMVAEAQEKEEKIEVKRDHQYFEIAASELRKEKNWKLLVAAYEGLVGKEKAKKILLTAEKGGIKGTRAIEGMVQRVVQDRATFEKSMAFRWLQQGGGTLSIEDQEKFKALNTGLEAKDIFASLTRAETSGGPEYIAQRLASYKEKPIHLVEREAERLFKGFVGSFDDEDFGFAQITTNTARGIMKATGKKWSIVETPAQLVVNFKKVALQFVEGDDHSSTKFLQLLTDGMGDFRFDPASTYEATMWLFAHNHGHVTRVEGVDPSEALLWTQAAHKAGGIAAANEAGRKERRHANEGIGSYLEKRWTSLEWQESQVRGAIALHGETKKLKKKLARVLRAKARVQYAIKQHGFGLETRFLASLDQKILAGEKFDTAVRLDETTAQRMVAMALGDMHYASAETSVDGDLAQAMPGKTKITTSMNSTVSSSVSPRNELIQLAQAQDPAQVGQGLGEHVGGVMASETAKAKPLSMLEEFRQLVRRNPIVVHILGGEIEPDQPMGSTNVLFPENQKPGKQHSHGKRTGISTGASTRDVGTLGGRIIDLSERGVAGDEKAEEKLGQLVAYMNRLEEGARKKAVSAIKEGAPMHLPVSTMVNQSHLFS